MLPPSPLVTCGVPIGCSEWLRPDVIAPEFGCSTAGCHGDEDKWGDSRVGTSHSLQIQIRNPWVEVRECWSQTTHWPFQLISQGFLLKFKGGPVSGVSCFVMTYYQYHAHETKGFFSFPPATLTAAAVLLLLVRQLHYYYLPKSEKAWGWVYYEQPVITHHFFERDCSLGFLEMETHVWFWKNFLLAKNSL